ncbi:SET domain-containing protein [Verticiella sediminum]|uniref:SET domain-containing protein n=1 Tax=Verticiella sediminum TaxID=1247510 RepID=A0A556AL65_9BURK|nr:SET domain-containing protein [Verticiella sediminum]
MSPADKPWHVLRRSRVHGTGVYAARKIPAGTRIFEYQGEIISPDEADRRHPVNPDDPFHTFFFALSNDTVIDGNVNGNDSRWVNHSCEPNCETEETDDHKVYIVALEDVARGDELFFDYGLVLDERITKTVREQYRCLCGTPSCRGTMLALKRKPAQKTAVQTVAKAEKAAAKKTSRAKSEQPAQKAAKNAAKQAAKKAGQKAAKKATKQAGKKAATKVGAASRSDVSGQPGKKAAKQPGAARKLGAKKAVAGGGTKAAHSRKAV